MFLAPEIPTTFRRASLPDGEAGIFTSLRIMRRMIDQYKADPLIREAAIRVAFLTPQHDEVGEIEAVFTFVRDHIRYIKDVYNVETIATPDKTLALQVGDCDDQVVLLCSLLESIGYQTKMVIESYGADAGWEHVYCQVCLEGTWIALDPTESVAAGWQPDGAVARWVEP